MKEKICNYCNSIRYFKQKYCTNECKLIAYEQRAKQNEFEFNFKECIIVKNDYNKMLLKYRNKLYLFTACYLCKRSILKKTDNNYYYTSRYFCSQLCMSKTAGAERTAARTIELVCDLDSCKKTFRRQLFHYKKTIYSFCNKKCAQEAQKKGGLINALYIQTMLCNYGVKSPLQSEKILHKAMKTIEKSNKKKQVSKVETCFYSILENHFDNVIQQKQIRFWPIDFYIAKYDTYIQIDGIHWHGLDKTEDELKKLALSSAHYKSVLRKSQNDRQQNKWFLKHNIKLVRITDEQVYNYSQFIADIIYEIKSVNFTPIDCFKKNMQLREACI